MIYILTLTVLAETGLLVLLLHRLRKAEKNIAIVMQVLSAAGPSLQKRVVERGTQVVLPEKWDAEEAYEYDEWR